MSDGGGALSPCANADFSTLWKVAVVYVRLVFISGSGSAKNSDTVDRKI